MLGFIASWLTPTSLFLLLNVVIGTIFLISNLSPPKPPPHDRGEYYSAPPLQRSPSLLDRVKSVNFSTFKFSLPNPDFADDYHLRQEDNNLEPHPLERAPSILERVKSISLSLYKYPPQNPDPVYVEPSLTRAPSLLQRVTSFCRSDSGKLNTETVHHPETDEPGSTKPEHNNNNNNNVKQMKKSASEKTRERAEEDEEEVEKRRPVTTRIEKTTSFGDGDDQGVDAKADDFINRFKQQLKLQRLDSLLRYRDMLKSRSSN
ncbi:hypothetical protein Godav_016734 [Gossypium davidsonii]|uniref:DUF4408 domain-containing protein n=1 Tax=Gossypium davidsonii TaxID=34287 RepID=A0A7J8QSD5_GOSDV|nr:hypothetical protein [Gossypium davidsonii]